MRIIINGANGKMGHIISDMAESEGEEIVARVDAMPGEGMYAHLEDFSGDADCVIDFSNHKAAPELMNYCVKHNIPVLIASTGHTPEELELIHDAAKKNSCLHVA